jgi:hypothetical protein
MDDIPGPATLAPTGASGGAPPRSALYHRTNGFLLGCFLVLMRYRFARSKFRVHRARVLEFFDEAKLPIRLPASHPEFSRKADTILQQAVRRSHALSAELGDFALAGAMACLDGVTRLAGSSTSDDLRTETCDILARHGLDAARLYERFLALVARSAADAESPGVQVDTVLTPALGLLVDTIEPLPVDPSTCFVAMPFRPPFAGYFTAFYRPLAAAQDCCALRMWGGLSGEAYVDLMLTVMRRCGLVIADLSGSNPNVVYEFGVARGLDKKVVPLCQRRLTDALPSNIASDQLLQVYSSREKEWPDGTALRCSAQVALKDLALQLAEAGVAQAQWAPGASLPTLPDEPDLRGGATPAARGKPAG